MPNSFISRIHDRMPVILPRECYADWLDPANDDTGMLREMLAPYPAEEMEAYPVTVEVGDARADRADLIRPLVESEALGIPPL